MIQNSLQYTSDSLNQYLVGKFGLDEPIVSLNGIVGANGNIPESNQNKLVLSLINIEKETAKPFYNQTTRLADGNFSKGNVLERYNLSILLSANFDDYKEALKFLNGGILFFQTYSTLDKSNFVNLPDDIERLEFDMDKLDYHQIHSLWTSLGAKYQPSVIYKMWLISLHSNRITGFTPSINNTDSQVNP